MGKVSVRQSALTEGSRDWARRGRMRFAVNGALRLGSNLTRHRACGTMPPSPPSGRARTARSVGVSPTRTRTVNDNTAPVVVGYQPTRRERRCCVLPGTVRGGGDSPLQSRALYASALPQRWLARDSFPASGEAFVASAFRRPGRRHNEADRRSALQIQHQTKRP